MDNLDIKKVFDKVPQRRLIRKLENTEGLWGTLLRVDKAVLNSSDQAAELLPFLQGLQVYLPVWGLCTLYVPAALSYAPLLGPWFFQKCCLNL
ncbi:hypothetical protein E2C01_014695 [Portunus trituberculatus]|uniref:Uncharacterized protein n=1 Tax=Portunus trituberculatus TaxID=210409 RepID=A0A5B7DJI8_PORTR|nr:hypothetical protein [Portunus trituberculatus]